MKDEISETVDRLRGFDSRKLQREMTDGLAAWHRRRAQSVRDRRQYLATACVMLLLVFCSYQMAPTHPYRLADGVSYEEVVALNNSMLGR